MSVQEAVVFSTLLLVMTQRVTVLRLFTIHPAEGPLGHLPLLAIMNKNFELTFAYKSVSGA